MDEIERQFEDKAVIRGKTPCYADDNALDIIERCQAMKMRIHGIDAFIITEKITWLQDYVDYSAASSEHYVEWLMSADGNGDIWSVAKQWIEERSGKGWMFEIVYETKDR